MQTQPHEAKDAPKTHGMMDGLPSGDRLALIAREQPPLTDSPTLAADVTLPESGMASVLPHREPRFLEMPLAALLHAFCQRLSRALPLSAK